LIEWYVDVCLCPLPQHPLTFTHGGGKPYPYVLTLKGKPHCDSIQYLVRHTVVETLGAKVMRFLHSLSQMRKGCE